MKKKKGKFNELSDMLLEKYGDEVGSINEVDFSIDLWTVRVEDVEKVKKDILSVTTNCKIIVQETSDRFTNIKILDIDL